MRTHVASSPDYSLKEVQNEARDADLFREPRDTAFPAGKLNTERNPIASPGLLGSSRYWISPGTHRENRWPFIQASYSNTALGRGR